MQDPNSLNSRQDRSRFFFIIGLGGINLIAFTLLICSIGFFCGLPVSFWQFPVAAILALIVNYRASGFFFKEQGKKAFFRSSLVLALLTVVATVIAGWFYDISFDGQWYHQETVIHLHEKWNPVYSELSIPPAENLHADPVWCSGADNPLPLPNASTPKVNLRYLNINHFSKGVEIVETAIYQITSRIESAKAVNGILLWTSFCLVAACLYQVTFFRNRSVWFYAVLLAFNPITVTQLLSFCVDGVLASALLCLLVAAVLLFREINPYHLLLALSSVIATVNIKFTGLVFAGIFCIAVLAAFNFRKAAAFPVVFRTFLLAGFLGIAVCGFHPYVTNLFRYHNPVYGLSDTRDEIMSITPPLLKDKNRFEKLFFSLSAHTDAHGAEKTKLAGIPKLPFTFNKKEIEFSNDPQLLLASFGPFFSGSLIVALILGIVLLKYRKTSAYRWAMFILGMLAVSILIIPDAWWLRFVPQLWMIPVLVLLVAGFYQFRFSGMLKTVLGVSLCLNIAWGAMAIVYNVLFTSMIDYQFAQLKTFSAPIRVEFCPYKSFTSNRVRFYEKHVPILEEKLKGPYIENVFNSNTRFETPAPLPDLREPFPIRLLNKIKKKD